VRLYRGRGADGAPVLFLTGDPEAVSKAAQGFAGAPVGAPKVGTVARHVADVRLSFDGVVDGDELLVAPPEDPPEAPPAPIAKAAKEFNAGLLSRRPRVWLHKADEGQEDRGLATLLVMEANDGTDGAPVNPDTQGDVFGVEDIEKAAHYWLENGGMIDLMHSFEPLDRSLVRVVESYVMRSPVTLGDGDAAYTPAVGSWLVTLKFDTDGELWKAMRDGTLQAVSPGGYATKVPFDVAGSGEEAAA